jgi:hypothetical protein
MPSYLYYGHNRWSLSSGVGRSKGETFRKGLIIARREELFSNTKTNGGKPKVLAPSVM